MALPEAPMALPEAPMTIELIEQGREEVVQPTITVTVVSTPPIVQIVPIDHGIGSTANTCSCRTGAYIY
jgi:hypothetical protein